MNIFLTKCVTVLPLFEELLDPPDAHAFVAFAGSHVVKENELLLTTMLQAHGQR